MASDKKAETGLVLVPSDADHSELLDIGRQLFDRLIDQRFSDVVTEKDKA